MTANERVNAEVGQLLESAGLTTADFTDLDWRDLAEWILKQPGISEGVRLQTEWVRDKTNVSYKRYQAWLKGQEETDDSD